MFSSRKLIVLTLTFKSVIPFELIFVYDVRKRFNFFIWPLDIPLPQDHLLKRLLFPLLNCLCTLSQKLLDSRYMSLFLCLQFWANNFYACFYSVPRCLYYCNLIVCCEVGKSKSSNFALLFQDCCSSSGPLEFPYEICHFLQTSQLTYAPNFSEVLNC